MDFTHLSEKLLTCTSKTGVRRALGGRRSWRGLLCAAAAAAAASKQPQADFPAFLLEHVNSCRSQRSSEIQGFARFLYLENHLDSECITLHAFLCMKPSYSSQIWVQVLLMLLHPTAMPTLAFFLTALPPAFPTLRSSVNSFKQIS